MSEFDNHPTEFKNNLQDDSRSYEDGFSAGLATGRSEAALQKQMEAQEKQRQAEVEAHRIFWDTAFLNEPQIKAEETNFDAKGESKKSDTDIKGFIADVQTMTPNEVAATEKELGNLLADKQAAYKRHHGWFESKPTNPMTVHRGTDGEITSIEFPKNSVTLPVTYWNSQVEANRIQDLSNVIHNATSPLERNVAQKALVEELKSLKLPQLAALEARKGSH